MLRPLQSRPWLLVPPATVLAIVVLVVGLAGLLRLVPANFLKPLAAAQVGAALNRPVSGDGDLWIHLGTSLRFVATRVTIHNPPDSGFPEDAFVTADRAEIDLDLWSVLTGQPRITHAAVDDGSLLFQIRADGVNNWNMSETTDDDTGESIGLPQSLTIRNSRIALLDVPAGQDSAIDELAVDFHPGAAGWHLGAQGLIRGQAIALQGQRGADIAPGVYDLRFDLRSDLLSGTAEGRVHEGPLPGYDGRIDIASPSMGQLADWLQIPLDPVRPDPGPLALAMRMSATGTRTVLDSLTLHGNAAQVTAQADLQLVDLDRAGARILQVGGIAEVELLDLDAYLPPVDAETELPTPIVNLAIFQALRRIADLPDTPVPLDWLDDSRVDYQVKLANLTVRGVRIVEGLASLAVSDGEASFRLLDGMADAAAPRQDPPAAGTGHMVLSLRRLADGQRSADSDGDGPVATADLNAAASLLPVGAMPAILAGNEPAQAYLTAEAGMSARGTTWLRLAAGLHGRLQAELRGEALAETAPILTVTAQADDSDKPVTAALELHAPGVRQSASLTASPVKRILFADRFDMKVQLDGDLGRGHVDGAVLSRPVPGFEGSISIRSEKPAILLSLLHGTAPNQGAGPGSHDPGPITLDVEMAEQDRRIQIRSARLQAGEAILDVTGSLERQQVLRADLSLTGSDIDLDRMLPPPNGGPETNAGKHTGAYSGVDSGAASAAGARLRPVTTLFPERFELALKADLQRLRGLGLAFDTVQLQVAAGSDGLSLEGELGPAGGGKGKVIASLHRNGTGADAGFDLDLESSDLKALTGAGGAAGRANLMIALHGSGTTVSGLAAAVVGTAHLEVQGLRHPDLNPVDRLTADLKAEVAATALTAQAEFPLPKVAPGAAVAIASAAAGLDAAVSHPATLTLHCPASLWSCAIAEETAFDMDLESGPSRLTFAGRAGLGATPARIAGNLQVKGERLSDWDGLVDDIWPHFGPYDLAGQIVATAKRQTIRDLRLTLGETDLAGTAQVDWARTRPVLDLDLTGKRLVTADFGSDSPVQRDDLATQVPLSAGWLDWARGRASLAVGELALEDGLTVADVALDLTGTGARIDMQRFGGTILGGRIDLKGHLEPARGGVTLGLRGGWHGGDLAALAAHLGQGGKFSGELDALLDAESSGGTMDDLVRRPSGSMTMTIDKGHIADTVLGALSLKLSDLFSPLFGSSTQTRLDCFRADATARQGEVEVREILLSTDLFDLGGKGSLSLPREKVDMSFTILGTRVSVASLAPAFTVSGDLESPEIELSPLRTALDLAPSLFSSLAGEVVNLVENVTGGGGEASLQPCQPGR